MLCTLIQLRWWLLFLLLIWLLYLLLQILIIYRIPNTLNICIILCNKFQVITICIHLLIFLSISIIRNILLLIIHNILYSLKSLIKRITDCLNRYQRIYSTTTLLRLLFLLLLLLLLLRLLQLCLSLLSLLYLWLFCLIICVLLIKSFSN